MQDDLRQRGHLEVRVGKLGLSGRYQAARKPQDDGGGYQAEAEDGQNLHENVGRFQQPDRRRVPVDARRALELGVAAAETRGRPLPHLVCAHIAEDGREGRDPGALAHRHVVGDAGAHPDLASALKADGADVQVLADPSRRMHVGAGLDGDVIPDRDQVERPGQVGVVGTLQVPADGRAELPQRERQQRRAAIHRPQRGEHHGLHPADAPEAQMHPAPLRVHAGCHIVPVGVTAHEALDQHHPEQRDKGQGQPCQVNNKTTEDELPEAGGQEERSNLDVGQGENQPHRGRGGDEGHEEDLQGGEAADGEHLRCGLVASRGACVGVRAGRGCGDGRRAARGRPATLRAVSLSLSRARTGTARPAACSFWARRAIRMEWPPASAKPSSGPSGVSSTALQIAKTSALRGHAGIRIRRVGEPLHGPPRGGRCRAGNGLGLRLGALQQIGKVRQTLPVDLARHGLHDEPLDEEQP